MSSSRMCIIEKILSHRQNQKGKFQFLIKWKMTSELKATWQPLNNLVHSEDLIEQYFAQQVRSKVNWSNSSPMNTNIAKTNTQSTNIQNKEESTCIIKDIGILHWKDFVQIQEPTKGFNIKYIIQQQRQQDSQQNKHINWKDISKVVQIKKDKNNKWIVLIQWFTPNKNSIWIQRDLLRIACPFVLMQFYFKLERNYLYGKKRILQQQQDIPTINLIDDDQ